MAELLDLIVITFVSRKVNIPLTNVVKNEGKEKKSNVIVAHTYTPYTTNIYLRYKDLTLTKALLN